jgi:hypothetical protein
MIDLLREIFAVIWAPILVVTVVAYGIGRHDGRRAERWRAHRERQHGTLFTRTKVPPFHRL